MRPLEFGWYLPTHGDTTAYGLMDAQIPGSPELCDRVVQAAEAAPHRADLNVSVNFGVVEINPIGGCK